MTDPLEVIEQTTRCLNRLWNIEGALTASDAEFPFPASAEFMKLMDELHRAQKEFEEVLLDRW